MFEIQLNSFLLLVSGVLSFMCVINLQNYIIREDSMYQSSMSSGISLYGLTVLTYILNGVTAFIKDYAALRLIIQSMALIFVVWYFSSGYLLYIYKHTRILLLLFVCSLFSLAFIVFETYFFSSGLFK
jgi:hypothetical protein